MIEVEVFAQVHPTEDESRVHAAIEKIFPGLEYQLEEIEGMTPRLVARGGKDRLYMLHELLRNHKILDTARTNIHIEGNVVTFILNKQVATAGKVSFPADEESLGSIWVEIRTDNHTVAERVVDWLAPPTEHGQPLFEIELEASHLYNDRPT
ncbi:MAG: RNA-binding domain-containing protein [ANME-2 cluster archaeon]|nr:RNA-binding domain-containing protein [ANME-2 cluster archaeon]